MVGRPTKIGNGLDLLVQMLYPGFVERYGGRVEPDVAALARGSVGASTATSLTDRCRGPSCTAISGSTT